MTLTLVVFLLVYAGLLLGRLPGLSQDRTGVALLGAIVLLAAGVIDMDEAVAAVDLPTLMLLFSFMALSSTFAGNLLIIGSVANIIVVDAAARQGVVIGWRTRASASRSPC